jgi:hypothetical protein
MLMAAVRSFYFLPPCLRWRLELTLPAIATLSAVGESGVEVSASAPEGAEAVTRVGYRFTQ